MSKITHDFKSSGTIFKVTGHIFDTCVSFSIFSESLDPLVAKMVKVSKEHLDWNKWIQPKNGFSNFTTTTNFYEQSSGDEWNLEIISPVFC